MKNINELLSEIEQRAEKATPGPWLSHQLGQIGWKQKDENLLYNRGVVASLPRDSRVLAPGKDLAAFVNDDAEFIEHSRTDIPALTKALRRAISALRSGVGYEPMGAGTLEPKPFSESLADIQKIMGGDGG